MPTPNTPQILSKKLDQLSTDYLKMSSHLIKLIELKDQQEENFSELMIREMLQMGRQTEQLILSISTLAKQLQSDGNNRN